MDTINTIKKRRSIRSFNDKEIKNDDIKTIIQCAMSAPSARNQQAWRFVVVDDKEILKSISENINHGKMCKDASKAIVVCFDTSDETGKLYGVQDTSAATQNILLSAASLGIGSVWIAVHPREAKIDYVKKQFKMPKNIEPLCIVALGYRDDFLKEVDRYNEEKIVFNTF